VKPSTLSASPLPASPKSSVTTKSGCAPAANGVFPGDGGSGPPLGVVGVMVGLTEKAAAPAGATAAVDSNSAMTNATGVRADTAQEECPRACFVNVGVPKIAGRGARPPGGKEPARCGVYEGNTRAGGSGRHVEARARGRHVFRFVRWATLLSAAAAAGAALAVALPTLAPGAGAPTTAHFSAVDFAWEVTGTPLSSATIAAGGTVTFDYSSGGSSHNADFAGGPAPTSCTQTAGANSGPVPPLPATPTPAGWSGDCRFDAPGTYAFHCDQHPYQMQGIVEVVDPNAPPPPTTTRGTTTTPPRTTTTTPPRTGSTTPPRTGTTTTTPGGGSGAGGGPAPGGSTGSGPLAGTLRLRIAREQVGVVLRGRVSTVAGARVRVTALVSNRVLAQQPPRHLRKVRIGSLRTRATDTGRASFALRLTRAARGALLRKGRLTVRLRVVVTPPAGRPLAKTIAVAVRAPSS